MNYKKLQNIEIEKVFCIFKNKNHTGTTFLVLVTKNFYAYWSKHTAESHRFILVGTSTGFKTVLKNKKRNRN